MKIKNKSKILNIKIKIKLKYPILIINKLNHHHLLRSITQPILNNFPINYHPINKTNKILNKSLNKILIKSASNYIKPTLS